jgi:ABC-type multidrug transport system ATPase subunit
MNVIETRALGKSYGSTRALHDCTLAIPGGHVVALVGPNGAGKSTLLNLAVGLATPSAGVVTVLGGFAAGSPPALDGIAFVAQDTPPMAMLDPLARHDFMATVMTAVADDGVSVVLSSHVLAELERVADYLVVVSRGRVQVAGEVNDLLDTHRALIGPAAESERYVQHWDVVHASCAAPLAEVLVRGYATSEPMPPGWEARSLTLEELTLAYLREPDAAALPGPARTHSLDAKERTT